MIPAFVLVRHAPWPVLPPGIFETTIPEIELRYGATSHRLELLHGLKAGLDNLFKAGCLTAYLDGSFVTAKPKPGDYEVCWDGRFVNPFSLDPLFLDFRAGTDFQKLKYKGEFFPAALIEARSGKTFLEFFQTEKHTGKPKGILKINNYLKTGGVI